MIYFLVALGMDLFLSISALSIIRASCFGHTFSRKVADSFRSPAIRIRLIMNHGNILQQNCRGADT